MREPNKVIVQLDQSAQHSSNPFVLIRSPVTTTHGIAPDLPGGNEHANMQFAGPWLAGLGGCHDDDVIGY